MWTLLIACFWLCTIWIAYVFIGYPIIMWLMAKMHPSPLRAHAGYLPNVEFISAAYNEERNIGAKLENYFALEYPRELLRFSIGSDGSTDRTDEIIREHRQGDDSVNLIRYERTGKTRIIYELAEKSKADIIVFTDVDILLESNALRTIVRCFSDPDVGGVVGRMVYHSTDDGSANRGEGLYSRLENALRWNESLRWTTLGPTGQCFAIRPGSYHPMSNYELSDDTYLAISIPLRKRRVWYEPSLCIHERESRTLRSEIGRRLRIGRQNAATFMVFPETRLPWRSRAGFQLWSHRILRNLSAFPALVGILCAILLSNDSVLYRSILYGSTIWMVLIILGLIGERLHWKLGIFGYPVFFTTMMACLTVGAVQAWSKGGLAQWEPPRA